jgi:hypothetical protein
MPSMKTLAIAFCKLAKSTQSIIAPDNLFVVDWNMQVNRRRLLKQFQIKLSNSNCVDTITWPFFHTIRFQVGRKVDLLPQFSDYRLDIWIIENRI